MPSYDIFDNKVILHIQDRVCETSEQIISSELFRGVLDRAVAKLVKRRSILLNIFGKREVLPSDIDVLVETIKSLLVMPATEVIHVVQGSNVLLKNPSLFNDFIEYVYNFWRSFERFIVAVDPKNIDQDKKPYHTFNETVGHVTSLIRKLYRDIQENITGSHPRVYRQIASGAEVSTIAVTYKADLPKEYDFLNQVPMMRQVLLYPPLILNPTMNKRTGRIERVTENPLAGLQINSREWLCYPAKVGELLIFVYFHMSYAEHGHTLCNLFQMAEEEDLKRKPDAVYAYGVPESLLERFPYKQVIFDDEKNDIMVAAVPLKPEFGYFGYLKKTILTLHNVIMMKKGILPFHGALVRLILKGDIDRTILFVGDTGAGKSETLEALSSIGESDIQDLIVIADDMGSIRIAPDGTILGYGTEIGAFLRLDDLQPGYALGQIDRAIIMSANQVNARIIIPVTTYDQVIKGQKIDFIFYANNYDIVDEYHPVIERFDHAQKALSIFREGTAMSKGTTTSTGLVHTYFVNPFGPAQYKSLHDPLAKQYFEAFFKANVFVGQMRSRLGLEGWERKGPEEAARELLRVIQQKDSGKA